MKALKIILALLLLGSLVAGGMGSALAQAEPAEVEGVIEAVDVEGGTLTITPDTGGEVTLKITESTIIEKEGEEATLGDLAQGDRVEATYNPESGEALTVEVESPEEALPEEEAAPEVMPPLKPHPIFGQVVEVTPLDPNTGQGSLELETKNGPVSVILDQETRYLVPAEGKVTLEEFAEIVEGEEDVRVAVLARQVDDALLARIVKVLPKEPLFRHFVGVVVETGPLYITITKPDGTTITLDLPEGLTIRTNQGNFATIVGLGRVDRPRALGAQNLEDLIERLTTHLGKIGERLAASEEEEGEKGKDIERLRALLERNRERHLDVLNRVQEKVRESGQGRALEAIGRAIEMSRKGYETALEKALKIKGDWESKWAKIEEGVIAGVDVSASTVTIAYDEKEVTLKVTKRTLIEKNGEEATLEDLALDDLVEEALYHPKTLMALKLVVESPEAGE